MIEESSEGAGADRKRNEAGASQPADDGIDVTLIRWMLSLSPPERLQVLQQHVRSVLRLRDAATRD